MNRKILFTFCGSLLFAALCGRMAQTNEPVETVTIDPDIEMIVTIHSQPKPVKWKTKEIVFYLKANQRFSGRYDLSGCLMSYFL